MEEQQREHIRDDLKGILKGELLFDELSRALYSTDASIFQIQPLGVAVPRDEEDVEALVRYAHEHRIPLIARGAGTGLAGESLGSGIIVDLSRHFRSIVAVGADTVRVQPGVIYRDLNARLAKDGRRFAPDPASGAQCTVGGMLANNASGARALRHGYTRDYVESLRVVLDSGTAASVAIEPRSSLNGDAARLREIVLGVISLLERHTELIRTSHGRTRFNRCGYLLHDVLTPSHLDLARLLIGSEGTLAIFTEATLRTIPLPVGRSVLMLGFATLESGLRASQRVLEASPSACELIDHRLLSLAREQDPAMANLLSPGAEVVLLVEFESDTSSGATQVASQMAELLNRCEPALLNTHMATDPEMIERLWWLRESVLPSLYGLRGGSHPVPIVEDVAVPVENLAPYLRGVQDVLQKYETTASYLIHSGSGQVHTRPFLDLQRPQDRAKLRELAEEIHVLALGMNGTVSTQHGTGIARTPWVERQYGRLFPALRELKAIFDPLGILNPGKIVAGLAEAAPWPLRQTMSADLVPAVVTSKNGEDTGEAAPSQGPLRVHLQWKTGELAAEVAACNGCGHCRTEAPMKRMCPIFRATHTEAAAPRAKANLLHHLLSEGHDSRQISADDVREVADLCVNCKMCAVECPAHVNIPKLMIEAKAANVAQHGLSRFNWVMARMEGFAAFGSRFSFLVNSALANSACRWLLEKFFNLSRVRRLPRFASRSFLRRARRQGPGKPAPTTSERYAYFVDVYANYNDPSIGEAVVAVLRHNGIEVYVPPEQVGCGMAPLAQGDIEAAREAALTNVRVLSDLAREGYRILCSEPTAALMLRKDYLDLIDLPDASLVAHQVVELTAFLAELHRQGRLRTDFKPLDLAIGHHVPCHMKALGPELAGPDLLRLIPGIRVDTIDVGCSGMAGTFGLTKENYALSIEAGHSMIEAFAQPGIHFGSSECSACRMQMEEGGGKRALHPVQYLALAYGLMPEIAKRFEDPMRRLVL